MARILLAEDDEKQAKIYEKWLRTEGHAVTRVSAGDTGLEAATGGSPPDLVVTDIMMPEFDGEELVMVLDVLTPDTPVVVVTGTQDEELIRRLRGAESVVDVLQKPIQHEQFRAALRRALDRTQTR